MRSGVFTGIGKKRGRKEDLQEGRRLTASAALHGYSIIRIFEGCLTEILTIFDEFVNISAAGENQGDLKQVAVHHQVHLAGLQFHQTLGDV